jgi:hypothetical protein
VGETWSPCNASIRASHHAGPPTASADWSRSLRKSCSMGSLAKRATKSTDAAESAAASSAVRRGARSTSRDTAAVKTGRAGPWPARGIGLHRSQASTSGGVMR